jgi:sulfide:quinone oxidoreductase
MWTLPLYELALHTAAWAADRGASVDVLVSTAEHAPLEAFGPQVGERVLGLLREAGVRVAVGSEIDRSDDGRLGLVNGRSIPVDLAVALPRVIGPAVRGLPHLSSGFTRVDGTGRVTGAKGIYAVGDMTDRPLKQGALAAQQADVTATAIAAAAAGSLTTPTYRPVMRALLTGLGGPLRLRNPPFDGDANTESAWWPANGIPGVRLGPLLAARGRCSAGA